MAITEINAWSPSVIATAIGFALVVWGAMSKKATKRKKLFMFGVPVLAVALIVIFFSASLPESLQKLNAPLWTGLGKSAVVGGVTVNYATVGQGQQAGTSSLCAVEDTTVTLSGQDKYIATAVGGGHRYRINGAPALTIADTGTITASPGDSIQILWNNATLTGAFGMVETKTVPCAGTATFSTNTVNNGTLTFRVFNEEGNLIDDLPNGENETLGAGDVVNLKAELQGQYQKEIPYGAILVVEYNKSAIDDVVLSLGGSTLQAGSVPSSHAPTYGVSSTRKAYIVPPIVSNTLYSGTVMIDADDTNNPLVSTSGDIQFTFYYLNYFSNKYKGGAFEGPSAEDVDNAVTRTSQYVVNLRVD